MAGVNCPRRRVKEVCLRDRSFGNWDKTDVVDRTAEQESLHDSVIRQLAEITASYSNASQIGLVLAATQADDLQWLLDYCKERFVIPSRSQPDTQAQTQRPQSAPSPKSQC